MKYTIQTPIATEYYEGTPMEDEEEDDIKDVVDLLRGRM